MSDAGGLDGFGRPPTVAVWGTGNMLVADALAQCLVASGYEAAVLEGGGEYRGPSDVAAVIIVSGEAQDVELINAARSVAGVAPRAGVVIVADHESMEGLRSAPP